MRVSVCLLHAVTPPLSPSLSSSPRIYALPLPTPAIPTYTHTHTQARALKAKPWTLNSDKRCVSLIRVNKKQFRLSESFRACCTRARVRAHFLESYHAPLVSGPGSVWDLEPWEGVYGTLHWEGSGAPEL